MHNMQNLILFSSLFGVPKQQCIQQVVDAETLLKVVSKIIDDVPNICLSKFKMCGGFEPVPVSPQAIPVPPPNFDFLFRGADASMGSNEIPEGDVVEEVFEDGTVFLLPFNNSVQSHIWQSNEFDRKFQISLKMKSTYIH